MKSVDPKTKLIQIPFRCEPDLHERIVRAMGNVMIHSGRSISKNEFLIKLIEMALKNPDKMA